MEIEPPYLQAIQAIAGKTPGEKQQTINSIAREIAQPEKSAGHLSTVAKTRITDFPEPLKPLVSVEVAKLSHQYEGIVKALKSEDQNVVTRALRAKWFFAGSDTRFVNAQYFSQNLFPEISLYARSRIVKNLAIHLGNTAIAADFFRILTRQYGVSHATPLLVACAEDFAFEMIIENKIILSLRMARALFRKYPNLVIKYLMLSKPSDDDIRKLYRIDINDYKDFIPEFAAKRFEDFMEIYRAHGGLDVVLGDKATKIFIKRHLDLLVEKPDQYLKLLSLKMVTQRLCYGDLAKMFKNLFPVDKHAFRYNELDGYLRYYKSERERLPLILDTFRQVYGEDLLSCKDLVDLDLVKVLPTEDRIKQARSKLEEDMDWHLNWHEYSWRCYLPTNESIPIMIKEMGKSSDASKRGELLKQLVYTCRVNDDEEALLKVLNYVYDRHRNDQKYTLYNCLSLICISFDLAALSSTHWEILNKYIKFTEMQGDLCRQGDVVFRMIEAALHYCSRNGLPLDDYIRIVVDIKMEEYYGRWNVLKEYPELERKFLDLFVEVIPKQYPFDHMIWKDKDTAILTNLTSSLWEYNQRHKVWRGKVKRLSIRDYPWLFEKIKVYILAKSETNDYTKESFLKEIKENERDVYHEWISDHGEFWTFDTSDILHVLKKQPQRVLDNWKECLEKVQSTFGNERHASLVIARSKWYQQLPIKFFQESMKTYNDPKTCSGSIATLALLADGETYAKILEPFIPTDEKMNVNDPEAKNTYSILLEIAKNLQKVNPPVSLDIVTKFCIGDYLQIALRFLTSVCCRTPVANVIPFAVTMTKGKVSVMKHGIRLTCSVVPLEGIYTLLTDLWTSESHTSIRLVVFTKIYHLFCKLPDSRSWSMMRTCIDNLNTNDHEALLKRLSKLSTVPNEYLHEYIGSVLTALKSMGQTSDDPKLYVDISCELVKNIDGPIMDILPEDYCQDLIKEYLFDYKYNSDIFDAGINLTAYSYLLSSKKYNESRFKFFGDFFRQSIEEYWDKPHSKSFKFYPMNFMVRKFFHKICDKTNEKHDVRIFETLLEIFKSTLQPSQDAGSYLDLVYSIAYHKSETSVDFGTEIARQIPGLIQTFSPECVVPIANRLASFIRHCTFSGSETTEESLLAVIEVFVNTGVMYCAFFAVKMLFNNSSRKLDERYKTVVLSLRNFHHPCVSWFLNEHLATFDLSDDQISSPGN